MFISSRNNLKGFPYDRCYRVRHITSDKKGNIWVGSSDGALSFKEDFKDPESIVFHLYARIPDDMNLSLIHILQMGMSWGALIAWDDIRSAEFLASLPIVPIFSL